MIELGKQYRTRDGREVRIYAVDGSKHAPVHGAVVDAHHGDWIIANWLPDGRFADVPFPHPSDIIEVKPTITRTYWLLHHPESGISAFQSEKNAREYIRIYCPLTKASALTGPHEVTFAEGDGL